MQKRKRRAYRSAREHLAQDFRDVARRMRRRMQDAAEAEPGAYRDAMAERLAGGAAKLRARTGSIAAADDEKNVHRSRIQVKRLRYLVEPLRKELPEARQLVRELGRLQDLLGELHDLHVLQRALARAIEQAAAERARRLLALAVGDTPDRLAREQRLDERLGLLALAGRARDERDRLFARLQRDWLGRAGTLLKDEVDSLSSVLARAA
jgi:CHAD domain-containing protein